MEYILLGELSAAFLVIYVLYLAWSRLYISPVAHIPGPKLAALTFWYEFYYDVVLHGQYTWKIASLHEYYGPIVRINPFEVHISDPEFYDEVYVNSSKRKSEQWSWTVPMFGTPNSILATINHDVHRRRRNAYSSYFSKGSIRKYSGVLQAAVDKLCAKFEEKRGGRVNLMHAYTALTGDIVTEYCFPKAYGLLDQPNLAPDYYEMWMSVVGNSHLLKQFPWMFPLMLSFPLWFVDRFLPDLAVTYKWQREWVRQIQAIKRGEDDSEKRGGKPSIFETLFDSDLPPEDKSISRLMEDAQTMVGAGSITASFALAEGTYYILENANVLDCLMEELEGAIPDPSRMPSLDEIEKLPYLTAIILETLRITYGVSHRLQRVCPDRAYSYNDFILPAGTPVSMTSVLMHDNPAIFPSPREFDPQRWLPLESEGQCLQKYLVAFSRGSRQCLGIELGRAELYVTMAGVFRRCGRRMKVVDTVYERDVEIIHDIFTPTAK